MKFLLWLGLITSSLSFGDTFTTHYNLDKPQDGSTTWGPAVRDNYDLIDAQMFITASSLTNFMNTTTGAFPASAISILPGSAACPGSLNVQSYLGCIDTDIGTILSGGAVNLGGAQTITGQKTFTQPFINTAYGLGVIHSNVNGDLTSSALIGPDLPTPTLSSIGAVNSTTLVTSQFLTGLGTSGQFTQAQPAFTDISGSLGSTQLPAFTGDVTSPSGSSVNTLATVNSNIGTFPKVTVNAKGLVTAATTLSSGDIPNNAANTTGNAATVTTNANLTGPITSTGNATAIASQTGTGSTFVMNTSPTLITPALGTPSALVGTNISGTASSLTAGHVTTNANLTGDVTSSGNATTLATVNSNVGSFTNASITVNGKGLITAASSGSGASAAKFIATNGGGQSGISSAQITGWTVANDTASGWNSGGQYYVTPTTGYYQLDATVSLDIPSGSPVVGMWAQVFINEGSGFSELMRGNTWSVTATYSSTVSIGSSVSGLMYLPSGTQIEIYITQNTGSSRTTTGSGAYNHWSIFQVL
jgi:hypothetical protein